MHSPQAVAAKQDRNVTASTEGGHPCSASANAIDVQMTRYFEYATDSFSVFIVHATKSELVVERAPAHLRACVAQTKAHSKLVALVVVREARYKTTLTPATLPCLRGRVNHSRSRAPKSRADAQEHSLKPAHFVALLDAKLDPLVVVRVPGFSCRIAHR